jgi:predicted transport protein
MRGEALPCVTVSARTRRLHLAVRQQRNKKSLSWKRKKNFLKISERNEGRKIMDPPKDVDEKNLLRDTDRERMIVEVRR